MIRSLTIASIVAAIGIYASIPSQEVEQQVVRIGTYETRAIAIAYAASSFNPVAEKMRAYEAAKQAGDSATVSELAAWGAKHQEHLHYQGFSRFPVDDLLAPVQVQMQALAHKQSLDAIAATTDYHAQRVQLVDITDELVKLYDPNAQTLATIRELRNHPALPPEEVAHDH